METEGQSTNQFPHTLHGIFPALSSAFIISMGYIDPGKWAACIDSGARFGGDLAIFLFVFNLVATVCQYLSAHIGVISNKNLAQLCNDEYDKSNRIFLGIQAALSIVMSDLAMILGIANGLHMMFKVDLFSAVLLTALNAMLYPLFSTLMENSKGYVTVVRIAGATFICYVLGMLIAQPEISISPITLPSKLTGENVYALMSLLGANVMPHSFYLHSSIAKRFQGSPGTARAPQTYDNLLGILVISSGIFLVNYVLMNTAANMIYSSGLVLSSFEDAVSLMEQPFWSPIGPLAFLLLISSSHISGLSWEIGREGGQTILYDFFGVELPGWLHCVTVRIFAVVPALYCAWYSGAEGMYQMLISTQIMLALLLPASGIVLCRIGSSGALMGANKISTVMEFFMMISFMAVIGLQLIFLGEMLFGDSAWVGYLHWNMSSSSIFSPYIILVVTGFASLCFTCRLFATPLRSADERLNAQQWKEGGSEAVSGSLPERQERDMVGLRYYEEQFHGRSEIVSSSEKVLETRSDSPAPVYDDSHLPDTIMDTDRKPHLTPVEEISSIKVSSISPVGSSEQTSMVSESVAVQEVIQEQFDVQSVDSSESKAETTEVVEKTVRVEGEPATGKDTEEVSKEVSRVAPSSAPESVKSPSSKLDEIGSGPGSLSRLSGLGRAARRQFAAVLDEFWGQLYDFHGQLTQDAKAKKLDSLLAGESNPNPPQSLAKAESVGKDFGSPFQSMGLGGSDSASQHRLATAMNTAYGLQRGSLSPSLRLDPYLHNSGGNALDNMERRYSSLRLPPCAEEANYQSNSLDNSERRYSSLRLKPSSDEVKYQSVGLESSERRYSSLRLNPCSEEVKYQNSALDNSERRYSSLRLKPRSEDINYQSTALDNSERRYSSLRLPPCSEAVSFQPAALQGYQYASYLNRTATDRPVADYVNGQREYASFDKPSSSTGMYNLRDPLAYSSSPKAANGYGSVQASAFQNNPASRTMLQPDRSNYELFSPTVAENVVSQNNPKKYHSLPDISGISQYAAQRGNPNASTGVTNSLVRTTTERSLYSNLASRIGPPGFGELSPRKPTRDVYPSRSTSGLDTGSLWSRQPFEQFGVANKSSLGQKSLTTNESSTSMVDFEVKLLQSLRNCVLKLLKLEGSEWLFRQADGADEDLIDRVAARERFLYDAEHKDVKPIANTDESQYSAGATKPGSSVKDDLRSMVSSVPNCGDGCVWKADLIVSFGVWCIHRILELSLMESRPELWGKYTYVLNRLQGVIEPAFFKQRNPTLPCFCLQIAAAYQQRLSPITNGSLPPPSRLPRGKFTNAAMLLEIIKDVEIAISSRKGRSGTAAGDVAFPKGKENLASVLKRYKRRLTNKPVGR